MIHKKTLAEDEAMKRLAAAPREDRRVFDWRTVVVDEEIPSGDPMKVSVSAGVEQDFDMAEVADTIGNALADLLLSREEDEADIFSDGNRAFVAAVSRAAAELAIGQARHRGQSRLTSHDVHLAIERALIGYDAHDVARSLVSRRPPRVETDITPPQSHVRLIRRNGQVVPWNE